MSHRTSSSQRRTARLPSPSRVAVVPAQSSAPTGTSPPTSPVSDGDGNPQSSSDRTPRDTASQFPQATTAIVSQPPATAPTITPQLQLPAPLITTQLRLPAPATAGQLQLPMPSSTGLTVSNVITSDTNRLPHYLEVGREYDPNAPDKGMNHLYRKFNEQTALRNKLVDQLDYAWLKQDAIQTAHYYKQFYNCMEGFRKLMMKTPGIASGSLEEPRLYIPVNPQDPSYKDNLRNYIQRLDEGWRLARSQGDVAEANALSRLWTKAQAVAATLPTSIIPQVFPSPSPLVPGPAVPPAAPVPGDGQQVAPQGATQQLLLQPPAVPQLFLQLPPRQVLPPRKRKSKRKGSGSDDEKSSDSDKSDKRKTKGTRKKDHRHSPKRTSSKSRSKSPSHHSSGA